MSSKIYSIAFVFGWNWRCVMCWSLLKLLAQNPRFFFDTSFCPRDLWERNLAALALMERIDWDWEWISVTGFALLSKASSETFALRSCEARTKRKVKDFCTRKVKGENRRKSQRNGHFFRLASKKQAMQKERKQERRSTRKKRLMPSSTALWKLPPLPDTFCGRQINLGKWKLKHRQISRCWTRRRWWLFWLN